MRKYLVIVLSILSLTFGLPSTSNAVTDGCPDAWTVLNEKDLAENLARTNSTLKLIYGNTLKLSTKTGYIFDASGENLFFSNSLDSDGNKIHGNWAMILSLIIPNKENFLTVDVSIEGCKKSGIFRFPYIHSTSIKNIPLMRWDNNPEIGSRIQSKVMQESVKSYLESEISLIKLGNFLKGGRNYKALKSNKDQGIPISIFDPFYPQKSNLDEHIFMLLPTEPGCLKFGDLYGLTIPKGKSCKFAVAMGDMKQIAARSQNPMAELDLIVIEELNIPPIDISKSITCTKDKTTKKVSGTNPKCPKGYKVKV